MFSRYTPTNVNIWSHLSLWVRPGFLMQADNPDVCVVDQLLCKVVFVTVYILKETMIFFQVWEHCIL